MGTILGTKLARTAACIGWGVALAACGGAGGGGIGGVLLPFAAAPAPAPASPVPDDPASPPSQVAQPAPLDPTALCRQRTRAHARARTATTRCRAGERPHRRVVLRRWPMRGAARRHRSGHEPAVHRPAGQPRQREELGACLDRRNLPVVRRSADHLVRQGLRSARPVFRCAEDAEAHGVGPTQGPLPFHRRIGASQAELSENGMQIGYGMDLAFLSAAPPREVRVAFVEPSSPANTAGVLRGDRLVEIDGTDIENGRCPSTTRRLGIRPWRVRTCPSSGCRVSPC